MSSSLKKAPKSKQPKVHWPTITLMAIVVALVTVVVGYGNPPFRFREGQIAEREIRLRTDVEIFNETRTRNEQEEAARRSPLILIKNPATNLELQERLVELANTIAQQPDFNMLSPAVKSEWSQLNTENYQALHEALANGEIALADISTKISTSFRPITQFGVLADNEIPEQHRNRATIEIRTADSEFLRGGSPTDVSISQLLRDDGLLQTRLSQSFENNPAFAKLLFQLVSPKISPTLNFDAAATLKSEENFRNQVLDKYDEYDQGDLVVGQGEEISSEHLRLLLAEHLRLIQQITGAQRALRYGGLSLLVAAFLIGITFYLRPRIKRFEDETPGMVTATALVVLTLLISRLFAVEPYRADFLPLTVTGMLLAIAYSRTFALLVSLSMSVLVSLNQEDPLVHCIVLMGGISTGVIMLDSVRTRTKLIGVGLCSGIAFAVLTCALGMIDNSGVTAVAIEAVRQFGCGLIAGFLVGGSLPFIEAIFGVVTDISLIELADTSHPLLQELVQRAPGTYNHSVTVSIIAEAAAKSIGCNSLLVRVSALFHDVGKMLKPQYFIENQAPSTENRHDRLEPAMSTLIIIGHVKDGADLGRQHHLPQKIIDMVEQHHGTTLVDYFYHEASADVEEDEFHDEEVEESAFRYPGPKPQSKEAGVMMLADCVESASRALSEPTPARIEKLVRSLTLKRLLDNQFDECGLTLHEVYLIQDSLTKSLLSVYHGRIKYPAAS